jgi:hypothetical protein
MRRAVRLLFLALALSLSVGATPALANHSWGGYHWARPAGPFSPALQLGDNVGSSWDAWLSDASSDWSQSTSGNPVRTVVSTGFTTGRKCRGTSGRVEVCDATYGNNGWLGLASIWIQGAHITRATVKMNDTYFNTSTYNRANWRESVMCQEVGHVFGLDHQSEDPNVDKNTCMDYYRDPNLDPNTHDYEELAIIYSHGDAFTTIGGTSSSPQSGAGLRRVRDSLFVENLGDGKRRLVWVFWKDRGRHTAPPAGA